MKETNLMKKTLMVLMAIMLLMFNVQGQTLKTLATYFNGRGSGTAAAPYQISSANDLEYLAVVCWTHGSATTGDYTTVGKYFQLQGNIDCSSITYFLPLGGMLTYQNGSTYKNDGTSGEYAFRGTFDGNDKTISNINIAVPSTTTLQTIAIANGALDVSSNSVNYTYTYYLGNAMPATSSTNNTLNNLYLTKCLALFGATSGATIKKVNVSNIVITGEGGEHSFSNNRAGLVGYLYGGTQIQNCSVKDVNLTGTATTVGNTTTLYCNFPNCDAGLVAWAAGSNNIINTCYVQGVKVEGGISGCFGGDMTGTTITNCYVSNSSNISSTITNTNSSIAGCFVGKSGTMTNCYTIATVGTPSTGTSNVNVFCSTDSKTNCYYQIADDGTETTNTTVSAKKSSTMQSSAFVTSLNANNINGAFMSDNTTPLQNSGYPVFNPNAVTLKTLTEYFTDNGKGSGTETAPYQISTANDLEYLAVVCWTHGSETTGDYTTKDKFFKVMNDIDCSTFGTDYLPIGGLIVPDKGVNGEYAFRGTFDGNNKTISNISIDFPSTNTTKTVDIDGYQYIYKKGLTKTTDYLCAAGLFGALYGATVKNVNVKTVAMTGNAIQGVGNRAGLSGYIANGTIIKDCSVDGFSSDAKADATPCAGGLVAWSNGAINTITNCYVKNATVIGGVTGCFGGDLSKTTVNNCYVSGTSTVYNNSNDTKILSGCFAARGNTFQNCYTTATITSNSTAARIAPFSTSGTITNCYYISTTGATNNTAGGISKTSTDMQAAAFITTLNGTTPSGATAYKQSYTFGDNNGYPIFNNATQTTVGSSFVIKSGEERIIQSDYSTNQTTYGTLPSTITIKDGGSLINNGDASLLTGKTINVERQLKVGAWNLFGLAQNTTTSVTVVLNANAGTTTNTAHNMAAVKYDYNNNNWNTTTYLGANAGTGYTDLSIGDGYFVYPLNEDISGNAITDDYTIVSQTVTPYTSDVDISTLTNNGSASTSGTGTGAVTGKWFALSNPFIGKISVSKLCSSIGNEQGEKAIYTYNATEGKWEIPTYVYPGQGFMVASAQSSGVYYNNLTGSIQTSNQGAKSNAEEETPSYITFTTSANNTTKEAFARIDNNASNGFDEKDAYVLLSSNNEDLVEPYFIVDNHAIMKNIYKTMPYTTPINFHASKESNTNLTVSNIPNNVSVSIVDLSNGQETALENGSTFNFMANEGENEGRFVVKFGKKSVSIEDNAQENNISLAMYPNPATSQTTLVLSGVNGNAQVLINDVQGRVVNTYNVAKGQTTLKINTNSLASGVYYVRVISNNTSKTEKFIVR